MAPTSRIPPGLQPFVRIPDDNSLLLLTSTLDASANWLVARFVCDALRGGDNDDEHGGPTKVLLVSWMRDLDFWRHEVRKATGLDLNGMRARGRFAFVDALSALYLHPEDDHVLPTRGTHPLPARGPLPARTTQTANTPPRGPASPPGLYTLSSASLDHLNATITAALAFLGPRTLIVLDNPDMLLASDPAITPSKLTSFFLTLHTLVPVSHLLVHLQADTALLTPPSGPPQPLQVAHQNLLVKTAHMSRKVLGVRLLDTGVAKDVSGVLRATVNRNSWANIGALREEAGHVERPEEQGLEVLYKVHGDGSVRVFERGAEVSV